MGSMWNIRYSNGDLDRAKALGKECFAIGYNAGGRAEAFMCLPADTITLLWRMAHNINHKDMAPAEALAEAEKAIADHYAKKAEREAQTAIPTGATPS